MPEAKTPTEKLKAAEAKNKRLQREKRKLEAALEESPMLKKYGIQAGFQVSPGLRIFGSLEAIEEVRRRLGEKVDTDSE